MTHVGVYKGDLLIGVAEFDGHPQIDFIDSMHDLGYEVRAISEKVYSDYDRGKEMTVLAWNNKKGK